MKDHPLVSVNIRTYNSEDTLRETLKSIKDNLIQDPSRHA